jgi:hypothetical protein
MTKIKNTHAAREPGPTQALFVRIPTEQARRLDRAAFELRRPKQALVSELLERYVDPDSPASLAALGAGASRRAEELAGPLGMGGEGARRRVTVETLEPDTLVVGHHSFRPAERQREGASALEVLSSEQAGELLQVSSEAVEELARDGQLPGRVIAGEWRFLRAALLEWLAHAPQARAGDEDGGR